MKNLLMIADAACDTGFARATHNYLDGVMKDPDWHVAVMGLNYHGHRHGYPYWIYPAWTPRGDLFGVSRITSQIGPVAQEQPDLVVIQNDPWNIPAYVTQFKKIKQRIIRVGVIAVDGLNCRGDQLNGLDHVIFWTKFAEEEARAGGYTGTSAVIPLGVDLDVYKPGDRDEARARMRFNESTTLADVIEKDAFIFLNINRNQPRKRMDLTIEYFAEFYHMHHPDENVYLFLHVCPTGDDAYDLENMSKFYKLKGRILASDPGAYRGATEDEVADTYRAADCVISTTQGEGWGLTSMEAMACGTPAILPRWSALGEWAKDAALMVNCKTTSMTASKINTIGGVPDKREFIDAMNDMYENRVVRHLHRSAGLELVSRPEYRWSNIGARFLEEINFAYNKG